MYAWMLCPLSVDTGLFVTIVQWITFFLNVLLSESFTRVSSTGDYSLFSLSLFLSLMRLLFKDSDSAYQDRDW